MPITIAGKQYSYQLDTGADVVIAYGSGERSGWVKKADFTLAKQIEFAGATLPSIPIFRMENVSATDVQGTVGLDLLVGRTFVIDFPKKRVCLLNRADMPDALSRAAEWVPAEIRNGKLFIDDVQLNGSKIDVIYDTGTSPDQIATDFSLWGKATGMQLNSPGVTHKVAQTWGENVEYLTAPTTGSLEIGKQVYAHALLTSAPSRPTSFHDNIFGASGALGNALFFDSIVILDLGSHPYFGVVTPVKAKN
ncbi:MAG: hypothetical protein PW735_11765 [Acidobacteriaceae bacterium]|nr:hypothetical protein [Acidobacteriaceae bacterium]